MKWFEGVIALAEEKGVLNYIDMNITEDEVQRLGPEPEDDEIQPKPRCIEGDDEETHCMNERIRREWRDDVEMFKMRQTK
ncbi:hypothetical protein N7495_008145 [Penicillium taxi]|uniref:uncharacterized protein n=1 Tax=Penicillium taxi TaxID=168475 RepID=UPI002544E6B0|nr:uncharacterized protein N7495_008145 [Penicillium taxi]KAJ5888104.1 hypothetical protein N7495_008145 [Penicillium taxi]